MSPRPRPNVVCSEPGCARRLIHAHKSAGNDGYCSAHDGRNEPLTCTCQTPVPHRLCQVVGCRTCKRVIL